MEYHEIFGRSGFPAQPGWETMTDPIYGDQLIFKNTDIADFNINSPSFSQDSQPECKRRK